MDEIIHYTSNKNFDQIKRSKCLKPLSNPQNAGVTISDRVRNIVGYYLYVVGIQNPLGDNWIEYGLMDYLLYHTTAEVKLKIPILEPRFGFVRDHAHLSPKTTNEKYGMDLFKAAWENKISLKDWRILECIIKYYDSTVPLEQYEENYAIPEIWLNQKTGLDLLTRIFY